MTHRGSAALAIISCAFIACVLGGCGGGGAGPSHQSGQQDGGAPHGAGTSHAARVVRVDLASRLTEIEPTGSRDGRLPPRFARCIDARAARVIHAVPPNPGYATPATRRFAAAERTLTGICVAATGSAFTPDVRAAVAHQKTVSFLPAAFRGCIMGGVAGAAKGSALQRVVVGMLFGTGNALARFERPLRFRCGRDPALLSVYRTALLAAIVRTAGPGARTCVSANVALPDAVVRAAIARGDTLTGESIRPQFLHETIFCGPSVPGG